MKKVSKSRNRKSKKSKKDLLQAVFGKMTFESKYGIIQDSSFTNTKRRKR